MPLFSRHPEPASEVAPAAAVPAEEPRRGLFGRKGKGGSASPPGRRSVDAAAAAAPGTTTTTIGDPDGLADPSILAARERVMSAERAEREADLAMEVARREVAEARAEVHRLELELKEEARLAKIKAGHAAEVSKRAKPLGRAHGF